MNRLDQNHLTAGLNDSLDGSHLEEKSNMAGGMRNAQFAQSKTGGLIQEASSLRASPTRCFCPAKRLVYNGLICTMLRC